MNHRYRYLMATSLPSFLNSKFSGSDLSYQLRAHRARKASGFNYLILCSSTRSENKSSDSTVTLSQQLKSVELKRSVPNPILVERRRDINIQALVLIVIMVEVVILRGSWLRPLSQGSGPVS